MTIKPCIMVAMYSLSELKNAFDIIKNNTVDGVPGCYVLDSQKDGPCVGIGILTHGNEPAGLAAFKYFCDQNIRPQNGKIIFLANNIQAAERFFQVETDEERAKCRFVDINFNRLPDDCLTRDDGRYEIARIQELYPIYQTLDFGLDIHSTTNDPVPSLINISDEISYHLFEGFPNNMTDIILNITRIQKGIPAAKLFGGVDRDIPVIAIEAGTHLDEKAHHVAIECVRAFCSNCGILPKQQIQKNTVKHRVYKVIASVFYPDESYYTVRDFQAFEAVTRDTTLGCNDAGEKIFAPAAGYTLFGNKEKHKPKKPDEDEEFFIVEKQVV